MEKSKNIIEKEMAVMQEILFSNYCVAKGLKNKEFGFNDLLKRCKIKKSTLQDILVRLENRKWIKKHIQKNKRVYYKIIHPFNPMKAPDRTKRLWRAWRIFTKKYWLPRAKLLKIKEKLGKKQTEEELKILSRQSFPDDKKEFFVVKDKRKKTYRISLDDIVQIPNKKTT